tara:strand:- start:3529 stop:3744 length:216 start_codon:yes stop_codon:yes gene_type:complete
MKYEVISGCVIAGKIYQTGSITEMSVDAAKILVSMGRIIPHTDEPKTKTENRSMGLEVSSEKPKTRSRKTK